MSSHHAQGLELLARVQELFNDIKLEATEHHLAVQNCHAFGHEWDSLRLALICTGEAADKAVAASEQQRIRYRTYAHKLIRSIHVRKRQANTCLSHFRHVTSLSNHARAVRQFHGSELLSLKNLQDHYEEALGPQAHMVHPHQTFLDTLGRKIQAVKRTQGLEMVYIRWIQSRAAADLTQQAENFHITCKRLDVRKRRAGESCRRANHLQKKVAQCIKEYEHLEMEVLNLQRAIEDL